MPDTPFSDNNMYYFWSQNITVSEHSTLLKNVFLQRVLRRTDINRVEIPDKKAYLKNILEQGIYTELTCREDKSQGIKEGALRKQIREHINTLTENMTALATVPPIPVLAPYLVQVGILNNVLLNADNVDKIVGSLKDDILKQQTYNYYFSAA